jgi:diguanylate cyclase (GGDEF)-like protein
MATALRNGEECRVVVRNYRKDGEPFWNEVFLSPVTDGEGRIVSYVGVQHDVSGRVAHEAELTRMALHDALTGLPNRRLLDDRIRMALERSAREGGAVALLMLDLDQFKRVNDTLGHAAGDVLLCQVASRLGDALRSTDTVARLGGDEFAVLCAPDLSSSVEAVADRVLSVFAKPFQLGAHRLPVTSSVGMAVTQRGAASVATLMREADVAMYRAKRRGQGLVERFDASASAHDIKVERLELEVDLHQALEHGDLHVEYQPKVDLRTGDVRHVEALVRWDHPDRGRVPPAAFIPIAEATGTIKRIGAHVLETACRDAAQWHRRSGEHLGFCVNLSAAELVSDDLLTLVRRALDRNGLSPSQIGFEWTESGVLVDRARAIENLRRSTTSAVTCPSTTSARAMRRSRICRTCRRVSSRSTGRSSRPPTTPPTRGGWPCAAPSSPSPVASTSSPRPRASRRRPSSRRCAGSDATRAGLPPGPSGPRRSAARGHRSSPRHRPRRAGRPPGRSAAAGHGKLGGRETSQAGAGPGAVGARAPARRSRRSRYRSTPAYRSASACAQRSESASVTASEAP